MTHTCDPNQFCALCERAKTPRPPVDPNAVKAKPCGCNDCGGDCHEPKSAKEEG